MNAHVYVDVDGVINAVCLGLPDGFREVEVRGYPIKYDPAVVEWLNALAARPDVTVHWLTTWCSDAADHLSPALGIEGTQWPVVGSAHQLAPDRRWWKWLAIQEHIAEHSPSLSVWIDDDLAYDPEASEWLAEHPEVIPVAPSTGRGLTATAMRLIDTALTPDPTT